MSHPGRRRTWKKRTVVATSVTQRRAITDDTRAGAFESEEGDVPPDI